ncbi:MAG: Crp/Fnr family transcriptional regulator, partial [Bacteroidota bacterium]
MDTELVLKNISRHVDLTIEESKFLDSLFLLQAIPTKRVIQEAGKACPYFYFVNEGILRAFFVNPAGKETTIMFAVKDWWITDMYAFAHQAPAILTIESLSSSEILLLHWEKMEALLAKFPKFERFFRIIFQRAYIREQLRTIQNLSLPAEERYQNFISKYPYIEQLVAQKQIASYLGITPEFLSKIRKG